MKIRELFINLLILWIFIHTADGFSQQTDDEIEAELKWIEAESVVFTEIATKTRMDADLVPGMVTVLKGNDLESKGIRTVFEALSLVPGLMTSMNSVGDEYVMVRGIGGGFFSGNMKLMLDGVVVNDILTASGFVLYQIPVAQIETIEIIRGPGSVIYGDYAYAGAIDVKTRKTGNQVCGRYSSYHSAYGGGGTVSYESPEKNLNISLNLYGWNSDGADVEAGKDRLWTPVFGLDLSPYSQSPGKTNEAKEDRFATLFLKYKDFSLSGQSVLNSRGDYFGIIHTLAPPEERTETSHKHQALEAKQVLNFSEGFKADIKAGMRDYKFEVDYILGLPPIPDIGYPSGSAASTGYQEREFYGSAEFIWTSLKHHTVLIGTKYSEITIQDMTGASTINGTDEMEELTDKDLWQIKDKRRRVFSAYLQDMYNIAEKFTLTGGLRYDDYNDMGAYLTPRISAVWQLAENHILKAQYSESVRAPTFTELYSKGNTFIKGNENLDSEHIRSYETEYIWRKPGTSIRMTLFYSELKEKIFYPAYADTFTSTNIEYQNADAAMKTKGAELEFEHELRKNLQAGFNISYADTDDGDGDPISGVSDWLANARLMYNPAQDYMFSLQYHYIGDRQRAPEDPRDDLGGFHTVDLAANVFNLFTDGFTLRAGVRNLFDTDIIYPAPIFKDEIGTVGYYYQDDFPRPGREWWVGIAYEF
jgi:iron complex outermembrane receptor protein